MSNRTIVTTVAAAVATLLAGSPTLAQQSADSALVLEERSPRVKPKSA